MSGVKKALEIDSDNCVNTFLKYTLGHSKQNVYSLQIICGGNPNRKLGAFFPEKNDLRIIICNECAGAKQMKFISKNFVFKTYKSVSVYQ